MTVQTTTRNTAFRLLKVSDVTKLISLSRSTIYAMVREGRFPKPLQVTPRRVAWREADVMAWMKELEPVC